MSERMTDERLAEIEARIKTQDYYLDDVEELLQALKAEREYSSACETTLVDREKRISELEAVAKARYVDGQLNAEIALQGKISELEADKASLLEKLEKQADLWHRRLYRPWQPCAQPENFVEELRAIIEQQLADTKHYNQPR